MMKYKCVLLGDSGVGKTSLSYKYKTGRDLNYSDPTCGGAYFSSICEEKNLKMDVWDTAGQERYKSLLPLYYRSSSVYLIVYDITSKETIETAKKWIKEVKNNNVTNDTNEPVIKENGYHRLTKPIIYLLANKLDLNPEYIIPPDLIHFCLQYNVKTYLSSSFDNSIYTIFYDIYNTLSSFSSFPPKSPTPVNPDVLSVITDYSSQKSSQYFYCC